MEDGAEGGSGNAWSGVADAKIELRSAIPRLADEWVEAGGELCVGASDGADEAGVSADSGVGVPAVAEAEAKRSWRVILLSPRDAVAGIEAETVEVGRSFEKRLSSSELLFPLKYPFVGGSVVDVDSSPFIWSAPGECSGVLRRSSGYRVIFLT